MYLCAVLLEQASLSGSIAVIQVNVQGSLAQGVIRKNRIARLREDYLLARPQVIVQGKAGRRGEQKVSRTHMKCIHVGKGKQADEDS